MVKNTHIIFSLWLGLFVFSKIFKWKQGYSLKVFILNCFHNFFHNYSKKSLDFKPDLERILNVFLVFFKMICD